MLYQRVEPIACNPAFIASNAARFHAAGTAYIPAQATGEQARAVERGYVQMIAEHRAVAESDAPPAIGADNLRRAAAQRVLDDGAAGLALGRDSRVAAHQVSQRPDRLQENDQLWHAYSESRAPQVRQQLIERYLPLVKFMARRMRINPPRLLDWDDVLAYGTIGLIQAVDRFDPAMGIGFMAYAGHRIRGSIIDALRDVGGVSRRVVAKAKHLEDTTEELQHQLGRQPSQSEIAAALGITLDSVNKLQARLSFTLVSLDSPLDTEQGDKFVLADTLEDRANPNPEELAMSAEIRRGLHAAIEELSEKERRVVTLYYQNDGDGLTLREVGAELGITGGRAHQLHVRAILRLRQTMLRGRNGVTGAPLARILGSSEVKQR